MFAIAVRVLAWLMFPVGAEVGFSSAGAGALGNAALLSLTPLEPAQVVGTDIVFGFLVSLIGSGAHWFTHATNPELLLHLIVGGVIGAVGGTFVSTHVPRRPLRFGSLGLAADPRRAIPLQQLPGVGQPERA